MKIDRRKTRTVKVGTVCIGSDHPISIQSMWKKPLTSDLQDVILEMKKWAACGCDIARFAVPNIESAEQLGKLASLVKIPLVADIHFNHLIALRCLDFPIAKIRINPGNIGEESRVAEVIKKAADKGVPIRVGVNSGSMPQKLKQHPDRVEALVLAAEEELEILAKLNFTNVLFSIKSSSLEETVLANKAFASRHDHPLHIGLTESGPLVTGLVRSTWALTRLLDDGIGDTVRISLSADCMNEIIAAKELMRIYAPENAGVNLVSCPKCGRSTFDVHGFVLEIQPFLSTIKENISVAVMGCEVNGPGESAHADLGISGKGSNAVIFAKGLPIRKVPLADAKKAFLEELEKICEIDKSLLS